MSCVHLPSAVRSAATRPARGAPAAAAPDTYMFHFLPIRLSGGMFHGNAGQSKGFAVQLSPLSASNSSFAWPRLPRGRGVAPAAVSACRPLRSASSKLRAGHGRGGHMSRSPPSFGVRGSLAARRRRSSPACRSPSPTPRHCRGRARLRARRRPVTAAPPVRWRASGPCGT